MTESISEGGCVVTNVFNVLMERGFVEQVSDKEGLRRAVEQPITCYVGFDPSADSFHVGHLVPIMALAHPTRTRCASCSAWSK